MKQQVWKNFDKNDEKKEKEKALGAYEKQYKGRCSKCSKHGHE